MANSKKKLEIKFSGLRTIEVSARNGQDPFAPASDVVQNGLLTLDPDIDIGTGFEKSVPFKGLVNITLTAFINGRTDDGKPNKDVTLAVARVQCVGIFEFKGLTRKLFETKLEDHAFQTELVNRVYPLVTQRLISVLAEVGYKTQNLPYNV